MHAGREATDLFPNAATTLKSSSSQSGKHQTMSIKFGVWIDHHKAILVQINTEGEKITQINSDAEKPFSSSAGPGSNVNEHPQNYQSENKQEHKFMNQLNGFYDEVLKELSDADPLLIIGPGEAKGEFLKRLQFRRFPAKTVEVVTADKMSDSQVAAKVREHFGTTAGRG